MAGNLRTTAIYTPKSVSEATYIIAKNPNTRIFAGGTSLMSSDGFYPNLDNYGDLITLENIPDFFRIIRTEKFIEVGSMVTLQQFVNAGANFISKEMYRAILGIGSSIVRSQATIGGSLCSANNRYFLDCILASLGAVAEIKIVSRFGREGKHFRVSSKWIPVAKLYDSFGSFQYSYDAILTRVRIPVTSENVNRFFRSLGSPMYDKDSCVMFALQYSISQNATISMASLCLAISEGGFFYSPDFNTLLTSISLPVSGTQINKLQARFEDALVEECPEFSDLQVERAKRQLATVLFEANTTYLSK